jgi:hypothetical protein
MLFNLKKTVTNYPFFNEPTAVVDYITTKPAATYSNLDWWIERTPEAIAILNAIVTDIKADGFHFEGKTEKQKKKAMDFCKKNFFKDQFGYCLWDWLVYGDAYLWKGIPSNEEITKISSTKRFEIKAQDLIDEDYINAIKHVPTTTMNIIHDGKRITYFKQSVQGQQDIKWSPEQIIHAKLMTIKGKVYGFSPTQACLSEMSTLGYLKDYAGNFFKNGGVPDWMFVLPNEMAGSSNHEQLKELLQKYKHPQSKHGQLVFTGEVEATKIGSGVTKDMEFRELAIYLTSVLALANNMPVSRVAAIIGATVKVSTGGDDLANEGYWSKIAEHQDRWEEWLNTQLFNEYFDVDIKFNQAWKTNEIKEQQRNQFAIANVREINNQLGRYDLQLNKNYLMRQLYIKDADLEKANEKFNQSQGIGVPPPQMDNKQIEKGAATESYRKEKGKETRNKNPSGFTKV